MKIVEALGFHGNIADTLLMDLNNEEESLE